MLKAKSSIMMRLTVPMRQNGNTSSYDMFSKVNEIWIAVCAPK